MYNLGIDFINNVQDLTMVNIFVRVRVTVYSDRPDQQPAASEAAQAAVGGQVGGACLAADARGVV